MGKFPVSLFDGDHTGALKRARNFLDEDYRSDRPYEHSILLPTTLAENSTKRSEKFEHKLERYRLNAFAICATAA